MGGHLASEFRAHVIGGGDDSYTAQIQAIRIPAGAYSGILMRPPAGMPDAGVFEQGKLGIG